MDTHYLNITNEIKSAAIKEGLTLTQAIDEWNEKYNKSQTLNNISNKLRNKTIKFYEVLELLDSIDYEIIIEKREPKQQYSVTPDLWDILKDEESFNNYVKNRKKSPD